MKHGRPVWHAWTGRGLPASVLALMLCGGCVANRSVFAPWDYSSRSPDIPWHSPKDFRTILEEDSNPPVQELPFSLAELIDVALKNNPQTRIAWAQARSAAANYAQTQSQAFPQISGSFTFNRYRTPVFSPIHSAATSGTSGASSTSPHTPSQVPDVYYSEWGPELSLSYLIFDFGQLRATTQAARYALYYADWNHNYAILELLQTITSDYYSYLYQLELLKAYEEDIVTAQLTLDAAELGRMTGVNDVSDVLQAKTQLLQNQTQWASQQQNVQVALATLLTDMGVSANNQLNLEGLPKQIPTQNILPDLEGLIALGLQNRPDLLAAEAGVRSNQQKVLLAQRQNYPTINSTFDIAKNYYNSGRVQDRYNFTGTVSLNMPIFAGFYYLNGIKIAKANLKQSEETLHESQLSIIQQITTYHSSVNVSFETLQFATAFLEASEEQYIVALAQYKQGTGNILDVVSAQSSLATARASLANAKQSWYTSLANLAYATGVLSIPVLPAQTDSPLEEPLQPQEPS